VSFYLRQGGYIFISVSQLVGYLTVGHVTQATPI